MLHSRSIIVGLTLVVLGGGGCASPLAGWPEGPTEDGQAAPSRVTKTGGGEGEGAALPGPTPTPPGAPPANPALDELVKSQLDKTRSPGIAAAIVKDGQLRWANGFGLANIAKATPVTADTLFLLASVSKTVTATAVMQLVESGALSLDAPITGLPFAVESPKFSTAPITPRMLLTHTSSILDPDDDLYRPGDTAISLERYLRGTLLPGGEYYRAKNWASWRPGAKYEYSNTGVTLLGYLVEQQTKSSFPTYCKTHIFDPLGMTEAAWRLADLDVSHVAMPYLGKPGQYTEEGQYGYPDYPAGTLRTSVKHLSTFLRMFMNGGELDGVRILKPETVAAMMKVHVRIEEDAQDQALVWYYQDLGGRRVLMHDGQDPGAYAMMGFDPVAKVGAILLSNGDAESSSASEAAASELFARLLSEGEKL